ncbi:hypothetical protein [Parasphingopyxis lamellibrachiae]|uniref:EF-hand domain-containing protein n=1 Tax=Parasphingopyxis lamellibrachiae TaxID=680125 RepID=A0A3D9FCN5_9SPHN|nr:hypothetical protein [Parasphingopyxis lamellibrachiae]RED15564.1 hypothetical protein DFR46_0561 [Parasphingopyxis lamellibrachiae]
MLKKMSIMAGGASFALTVAACSSGHPEHARLDPERLPQRAMLFVSPAGKPFRNTQAATTPIAQWFGQADADGDGVLRADEFRADFAAAFAEFDRDGDGDIQGPEVTHYEQEVFPEIVSRWSGRGNRTRGRQGGRGEGAGGAGRSGQGGRRGGRGGGQRGSAGGQNETGGPSRPQTQGRIGGAARFGLLPIHHPIMQADRNIDRRVTGEEFQIAADIRYGLLDVDGDGSVALEQLVEMLPQRRR